MFEGPPQVNKRKTNHQVGNIQRYHDHNNSGITRSSCPTIASTARPLLVHPSSQIAATEATATTVGAPQSARGYGGKSDPNRRSVKEGPPDVCL